MTAARMCAAASSGVAALVSSVTSASSGGSYGSETTCEVRNQPETRLAVLSLGIALLADGERSREVNEQEVAALLEQLAGAAARLVVGRNDGADGEPTAPHDPVGEHGDPMNVRVAIGLREAEGRRPPCAEIVAVEQLDGAAARVSQAGTQRQRDRRLAGPRQAREEDRASVADIITDSSFLFGHRSTGDVQRFARRASQLNG